MSEHICTLATNEAQPAGLAIDMQATTHHARCDLRILQAYRRIARAIELQSKYLASEYQITAPQLLCLLALEEKGPLTGVALARTVFLSPSTMAGILERLEEKQLIIRHRNQQDRRLVKASITEKGRVVAANAPSPLQSRVAAALEQLPADELENMAHALEQFAELMETPHENSCDLRQQ